MPSYGSGELVWDTTEATAPRWILLLDGPPGAARQRVDPQDPSTPRAARAGQLGPPAAIGGKFTVSLSDATYPNENNYLGALQSIGRTAFRESQ